MIVSSGVRPLRLWSAELCSLRLVCLVNRDRSIVRHGAFWLSQAIAAAIGEIENPVKRSSETEAFHTPPTAQSARKHKPHHRRSQLLRAGKLENSSHHVARSHLAPGPALGAAPMIEFASLLAVDQRHLAEARSFGRDLLDTRAVFGRTLHIHVAASASPAARARDRSEADRRSSFVPTSSNGRIWLTARSSAPQRLKAALQAVMKLPSLAPMGKQRMTSACS